MGQHHAMAAPYITMFPVLFRSSPSGANFFLYIPVLAFSLLAGFDLGMNAAAGAAAATVGAHLNRVPVTTKVLRVAAVAGMTKSAITSFHEVVARIKVNFAFTMMLMLLSSSFGICLVVTAEVSNSAYGRGK